MTTVDRHTCLLSFAVSVAVSVQVSPPPTYSIHELLSLPLALLPGILPVKLMASIFPFLITCPTKVACFTLVFSSNSLSVPSLLSTCSFDILFVQNIFKIPSPVPHFKCFPPLLHLVIHRPGFCSTLAIYMFKLHFFNDR